MKKRKYKHIIIVAIILYIGMHFFHSYCFHLGGNIQIEHNTWYLSFGAILIFYSVFFYILRRRQKSNTTFKTLVKAGVVMAFFGILTGNLIDQLYYRSLDDTSRTHIIDHIVDQRIKNFDSGDLDIFQIEKNAMRKYKWGTALLGCLLSFFLHFIIVIVLGLIFSVREVKDAAVNEYSNNH